MTQFCNLENENHLGEINVETKITEKNTSCWHSHLFCFGNGAISAVACCHNVQFVGQKPNLRHTRWLHFLTGTTAMPKHQQIILEWRTFSTLHRDLDHWREEEEGSRSQLLGRRQTPAMDASRLFGGWLCMRAFVRIGLGDTLFCGEVLWGAL